MRTTRLLGAAGAAFALAIATAPASHASTPAPTSALSASSASCDATAVGVWGTSGSFEYKGRDVKLLTEKVTDKVAFAQARDVAEGDKLWIDRSTNTFKMGSSPGHPSTSEVRDNGGWKQCGPFTVSWFDANVMDAKVTDGVSLKTSSTKSRAVRPCIDPAGTAKSKCGKWYVDHK